MLRTLRSSTLAFVLMAFALQASMAHAGDMPESSTGSGAPIYEDGENVRGTGNGENAIDGIDQEPSRDRGTSSGSDWDYGSGSDSGTTYGPLFKEALSARAELAQAFASLTKSEKEDLLQTTAAALTATAAGASIYVASPYLKRALATSFTKWRAFAASLARRAGVAGLLIGVVNTAGAGETLEYQLTTDGFQNWLNTNDKVAEITLRMNPDFATFVLELSNQLYAQ